VISGSVWGMYAFIHIPKTAGSTLRHLLRCDFGSRHCDVKLASHRRAAQAWVAPRDIQLARRVYPHLAGIAGHRVVSFSGLAEACPDIRYFTMLREPIARSISHFGYIHRHSDSAQNREDLVDFLQQPVNRNLQTQWLCGEDDPEAAIRALEQDIGFVGLMERFDESMLLLQRWLGESSFDVHYAPRNRARRVATMPFREDPELLSMLTEANAHDMAVYHYVVEQMLPKQVHAYGGGIAEAVARFQQENQKHHDRPEPLMAGLRRNLLYKPMLKLDRGR
jgi:hypothetical protein